MQAVTDDTQRKTETRVAKHRTLNITNPPVLATH